MSSAFADVLPAEKKRLLVTAYYSPLPNQRFYIRGSYEADIRLNGRGTNGADGTEVHVGMLAAPRTYPFGTRIRIPGLGVGEVHDRGGAIVARKNYDRIDVWMGHGEEGLARALNWGARLVEGEVYRHSNGSAVGIDYSWLGTELSNGMVARFTNRKLQDPKVFNKPISRSSPSAGIKELQEALSTFGYYNGPVTGVYGPQTTEAVLAFQLAEGVIPYKKAAGAGNFGPKTRAALKSRLENFNSEVMKEQRRLQENTMLLGIGLGKNSNGDDVRALQQMLWELGYYDGELDGVYDTTTIDAVFEFQKDNGILNSEWDRGAGYFGKKTHAALISVVDQKIKKVGQYPMQMQVWVPARRDLPKIASLSPENVSMERQALYFAPELINKEAFMESKLFWRDIESNDRGAEVVKLQNMLIEQGYLRKGLNTGYYGEKTKSAVLKFQLENGIVQSDNDIGAGRVGPKTRKALNKFVA